MSAEGLLRMCHFMEAMFLLFGTIAVGIGIGVGLGRLAEAIYFRFDINYRLVFFSLTFCAFLIAYIIVRFLLLQFAV